MPIMVMPKLEVFYSEEITKTTTFSFCFKLKLEVLMKQAS